MTDDTIHQDAARFFDAFVTAFHTFDGAEIARRYQAPYQALHADGAMGWFTTHREIAEYFQRIVDGYHREGARSCRYRDLEATAVGPHCLLGTVTWELADAEGAVLTAWRESYTIARTTEGPRIFASVDH